MYLRGSKTLQTIATFLLLVFLVTPNSYSQGYEWERRTAEQAKEESIRRIEKGSLVVDESVNEVKDTVAKFLDDVLTANFHCEKSVVKNSPPYITKEQISYTPTELAKYKQELEDASAYIERRSSILQDAYKRSCYEGSNERIDTYMTCLTSREFALVSLKSVAGIKRLLSIQSLYVYQPFEKYSTCIVEKNRIDENLYLNASKAVVKSSAIIKSYSQQLKASTDALMGSR
jgi:hypothetical protein